MDSEIIKTGSLVVTGIAGFILRHLTGRFFDRIRSLPYTSSSVYVGSSTEDSFFGSVEILHNGKKVNSLYLTTLELINESAKDFRDLHIVLYADLDSLILFSHAQKVGQISNITFQKDFVDMVMGGKQPEAHFRRRDYQIPILNRGDKVKFQLLITNLKSVSPNAWMSCEHSGLRLNLEERTDLFWGEQRKLAALLGIIISAVAVTIASFLLYKADTSSVKGQILAIAVPTIIGVFCIIPGAGILKAVRWLKGLF